MEGSIVLFQVSANIKSLAESPSELDLDVEVRFSKSMSVEEMAEFQEKIGDCALIVRNAIIRKANEKSARMQIAGTWQDEN